MRSNNIEVTFTQAARREQMIQATIDAVAEHGIGAATLARIADRIGIAKGGIIYHFSNRQALSNASLDTVFERLADAVVTGERSHQSPRCNTPLHPRNGELS